LMITLVITSPFNSIKKATQASLFIFKVVLF